MNIYQHIILNIKHYRSLKGLTLQELADLSGYSFEYIRKVLSPSFFNNKNNIITLQVVYDISKALGVSMGLLITEDINNKNDCGVKDNEY